MVKRILLSTAVLLALATTSWAQEIGGEYSGEYVDAGAYSGEYVDAGAYSGEYVDDGAYSEATESRGCASGTCGVGQDYFSTGECGCGGGADYKYTRLFGGLGYVDDVEDDFSVLDFDDGWGAGIALGRRVGRRRTELELGYRHNSSDVNIFDNFIDNPDDNPVDNGNLSTTTGMVNMMFDFLKIGKSNVYAGGGIGLAYADLHSTRFSESSDDEAFAYQGIIGIDREIRNGIKGFVEYRYLTAEFDFGLGNGGVVDYDAQNIFFGVEFRR